MPPCPLIRVIIKESGRNRRKTRAHLLAIANGVIRIADRAVDGVRVAGDGLAGQVVEIVVG